MPIIVAGSGGGNLVTGKHINMATEVNDGSKQSGKYRQLYHGPLANLWLTQAKALGLNIDSFADSSGEISQLIA